MHHSLRIGGGGTSDSNSLLGVGVHSKSYGGKIAGLYDLEETLGRGHFAVVKLARHVFTGEKVAVKVIDKNKLDDVSKAHLFQEVRCMKLVQHPNVVRLYEVIDTATKLYLILELGDGGDLYEYIIKHDAGLSEDLAKEYFSQIVRAISYCHQLHVVHRDLKPENVVFFKKLGVVKLTDFGFSNKFNPGQKLETSCGSLAYSAPEILLGDSYDAPAVDVWSLGVILYMLVCGQPPFQEANDSETLTMIMDCKYHIPNHVSAECRDLIGKMLVRNPEKRATLSEISQHKWLVLNQQPDAAADISPLVSKVQLSDDDHNLIVQKIVNGNIATKDEIQECLEKNEYNHITATYYLLAERKLRFKRLDDMNKSKRPEHLEVPNSSSVLRRDNTASGTNPTFLKVPRTPGEVPQRSRKCSIVQEDEEEEDIPNCREELRPALNRRGSRSEGRLNLALQERLADSERKKTCNIDKVDVTTGPLRKHTPKHIESSKPQPPHHFAGGTSSKTITECSTVSIPIITTVPPEIMEEMPLHKTMPAQLKSNTNANVLTEIFESGDTVSATCKGPRQFSSKTPYEQRRSKFHKARTTSCSSSDASDEDSEKNKKRNQKLNTSARKFQGRRDSHDDSSDSQEPGTGKSSKVNGNVSTVSTTTKTCTSSSQDDKKGGGGKTGRTHMMGGRQHKLSTRGKGETRLRESQSLNRITEVQEDNNAHAIIISTALVQTKGNLTPKVKGIGARILHTFNITMKKSPEKKCIPEKCTHISRKDTIAAIKFDDIKLENDKIILKTDVKTCSKKVRILGKSFQVHKKLCIPLPGLFSSKNRLYKAQSCSSLSRDKINADAMIQCRHRAVSVIRNSVRSVGDINQNKNDVLKTPTVVQLNNVCSELTEICGIHLGQASRCCSFC